MLNDCTYFKKVDILYVPEVLYFVLLKYFLPACAISVQDFASRIIKMSLENEQIRKL